MRTLLVFTILLIFIGCRNSNTNTNKGGKEVSNPIEVESNLDNALTTEAIELVKKLEGIYYTLRKDGTNLFYEESCSYNPYDVKITEVAEESGYWDIYWLDESFSIHAVKEKDGDIYITSKEDIENTFIFSKNTNDLLWDFAMMGSKETTPIVKIEDVENFEMKPCTDAEEIMKRIPTTWYQISELDGKEAIYEPCMEAPIGITIDANSIDFWSGSDPYRIVSMSKLFNRITIKYQSIHNEDIGSIIMHNLYGDVIQFGNGTSKDHRYVNEQALDMYPIIKEECE
ncbi:hypothetical protein [Leptobacterium sp. I13]|uniref:hypothetical protein n=1 Tax=Leptobacterium meishanense TaxID=3128904 RepID=UPI0030ED65EC